MEDKCACYTKADCVYQGYSSCNYENLPDAPVEITIEESYECWEKHGWFKIQTGWGDIAVVTRKKSVADLCEEKGVAVYTEKELKKLKKLNQEDLKVIQESKKIFKGRVIK
tara:strand:+ start:213 stop:545 length:333 start_codon:yes stop_codon:yes gene_type:complete